MTTELPRGTKKEAILTLYRSGMTRAVEIQAALHAKGIDTSINNIYVTLSGERKSGTLDTAAAPKAPKAEKAPKKEPAVQVVETAQVHPDLARIMQAAALQFGAYATEQAAKDVSRKSQEALKQLFFR
jgi:hypothetical protein